MAISLLLPVVSTSQPNLFDIAIRMVPRTRAWRFSSARPGSSPANGSASMPRNAECASSMGTVNARIPRLAARVSASVTLPSLENREGIRTPGHVLGAEGVDGDGGHQRGVDPTGEPDEHVGEAVLRDVVARAEHERLVDLVHRREQRLDPRLGAALAQVCLAHRHLGKRGGAGTAPGVEQPAAECGPDVDVDHEEIFLELRRARDETTTFVEEHRRAVEDELVLPADQVHVEHGHRRVGCPRARASSRARGSARRRRVRR